MAAAVALLGGGALGLGLYAIADRSQPRAGSVDGSLMHQVGRSDLDAAGATLAAEQKDELLRRAKACEAPLFYIKLSKIRPDASGVVRIRSGAYTSPPFTMRDSPQLIAIPPPTPYPTGSGVMHILGNASMARFELIPGIDLAKLTGEHAQPFWWYVDKPCGT